MKSFKLMSYIQKLQFYAIELNLYLDSFPNNQYAREGYDKVSQKLDELIDQYEYEYGTIRNFGSAYVEDPSSWVNQPWPWEL